MNKGKISIIVPIYKVENELDRCVKSIMQQTYQNIEIILVDDGSPDKCPKMCDDYAKQDDRIIVIHKKNGGLSDARNAGLRAANGEYIMYVDSDDYIELDACQRLISYFVEEVDVVVGVCKKINGSKISFQEHTNLEEGKIYDAKEYVICSIKKNEWYAPAWLNMYRKVFLIDNNLYYKVGYCYEDIEMLPRLFLSNPKVVYMNYPFYNYIVRENSIMTSETTVEKINMSIDIYSEWYKLIESVRDEKYRKILYGVLVKYYMASARKIKIKGWKSEGVNFRFAWKYALSCREKIKVLIYNFFPKIYIKI